MEEVMRRFLVLLLCLGTSASLLAGNCPCKKFLEGRIPEKTHRYNTFLYALNLMEERHVQTIVETGTARNGLKNCLGDGCSTMIFGDWARTHNAKLYSVDIDSQSLSNAAQDLGASLSFVNLVHSDSISYLRNFDKPIDFLYLDSYDFESNNPDPSQQHHLKELLAAYPKLHANTIVMIDDCDLPHGGKGKLVIDYLLQHDWKIVEQGYQVVLVRKA